MTSQPIRLSTNFMTLIPSLTFIDYEWFPWSICNGCGMPAGNAYPSGHLVPSPFWDLLMLQLLRPNSSNLPCLYSTFHLEYPLVLSRFCFDTVFDSSIRHIAITNSPFRFAFSHLPRCWQLCDKSTETTLYKISEQVFLRFSDSSKPSQSVLLIYESSWVGGLRKSDENLLENSCKFAPVAKVAHILF